MGTGSSSSSKAAPDDQNNPAMTTIVRYFDNTSRGYGWLLPGWYAEERFVPSRRKGAGRTYRHCYDPTGRHKYKTRGEVLHAWEDAGLICLDYYSIKSQQRLTGL